MATTWGGGTVLTFLQTLLTQAQETPMDVGEPGDSQDKEPGPSRVHTIRERYSGTYRRARIDSNIIQQK